MNQGAILALAAFEDGRLLVSGTGLAFQPAQFAQPIPRQLAAVYKTNWTMLGAGTWLGNGLWQITGLNLPTIHLAKAADLREEAARGVAMDVGLRVSPEISRDT